MEKKPDNATPQRCSANLSLCVLLLAAVTAFAQHTALTPHIPEAVASHAATLVGHLSANTRLSLALSLPLRNQAELDNLLQQIYDPQSPIFHKYLTVVEFTERFGPTADDYAALQKFTESKGLTVVDKPANRMVLNVEGSTARIEAAFKVTLNVYQHPTEARTFYAPDREPTLDLDVPLLHITGLDDYSLMRPKYASLPVLPNVVPPATGSGPSGSFLGSDLRAAYYGSGPLKGAGQSVGLFEGAGWTHDSRDIQQAKLVIDAYLL